MMAIAPLKSDPAMAGCPGALEASSQTLVQPAHQVSVGAIGFQIGQAGKALLRVTAQLGSRLAGRSRADGDEAASPGHESERDERKHRQHRAHPPVGSVKQDENAQQEHTAPQHLNDEAREEVGDRGDITVNPLD